MSDNSSGRRWARFGLIFGAGISLLGNVTHTVLAESTVNLGIRLPLAIVWPVALVVAVEILVRVSWRRSLLDWAGRFAMVALVGSVAGVVSYRHLNSLMHMAGEDDFSTLIGPVAIDGLMLGSTIALLAIRAASALKESLSVDEWAVEESAPVSPAPISAPPLLESTVDLVPVERTPRTSRSAWDAALVVDLALSDTPAGEAAEKAQVGVSTYRRYLRVARMLRVEPRQEITAAEKVPAEHVEMMRRKLVTR